MGTKACIYVCSLQPYRQTLDLNMTPPVEMLSIEDVCSAAEDNNKPKPVVSNGSFLCIANAEMPIYVFRNNTTISCTNASMSASMFPPFPAPLSRGDEITIENLMLSESPLKVGAEYLYGTKIQHDFMPGKGVFSNTISITSQN